MRPDFWRRVLCVGLAFLLLFCVGCSAKVNGDNKSEYRLTVEGAEHLPVAYTDEQKNHIASLIVGVLCHVLYENDGMVLTPEMKEGVQDKVYSTVLPALAANGIGYDEFIASGVTNFRLDSVSSAASAYMSAARSFGNKRAGSFFYDICTVFLAQSEADALDSYHKNGYEWKLDDAERYRRQMNSLKENISREDFALVCSTLALCAFSASGSGMLDGNLEEDADAMLLTFVRRQAAMLDGALDKNTLAASARLIFELTFCELSAPEKASPTEANMWYALGESGEAAEELGKTFTEFLTLYSCFADELTRAEANVLLTGTKEKKIQTVATVLMRCERELAVYLAALGECRLAGDSEWQAIVKSGAEQDFEAYKTSILPTASADVVSAIENAANGGSAAELYSVLECFAFGVAPYVTFAFCH